MTVWANRSRLPDAVARTSVRKRDVLVAVIGRQIEATLAPVLGPPFRLGRFNALLG